MNFLKLNQILEDLTDLLLQNDVGQFILPTYLVVDLILKMSYVNAFYEMVHVFAL